ncbi:stage II sporulation protein E [Pelagirhabdus alkalitolerans]|nr:stage II sporulation protein E [Pelagirhabdus alkalitolerans]
MKNYFKKYGYDLIRRRLNMIYNWAKKKDVIFYLIAFLLARATLFYEISPFILAYLISVWVVKPNRIKPVIVFSLMGGMTLGLVLFYHLLIQLLLFGFFLTLNIDVNKTRFAPFIAFGVSALSRLLFEYLLNGITAYAWLMMGVEAFLCTILLFIFIQSTPLLVPVHYKLTLKTEEVVCFTILITSVICGLANIALFGLPLDYVASRYFILLLSLSGGATIGATAGVVIGLLLSFVNQPDLTQLSLLAFTGLLGGLMKDANKVGVSLGLLIGTVLLGIYQAESLKLFSSFNVSLVAIILLYLTPKQWIKTLARFIPGTYEQAEEQRHYLSKLRNTCANRMENFSDVFLALSETFIKAPEELADVGAEEREMDQFLSQVTEKTCQTCFKKTTCWTKQFDKTYQTMATMKTELEENAQLAQTTQAKFYKHCLKALKVEAVMKEELAHYHANQSLKRQVGESRQFVANQLLGVSEVMNNFAKEMVLERHHHEKQEREIWASLQSIGLTIEEIDIYSLNKGNIDIEMTIAVYQYNDEGSKLIAPILSDILNESVVVKEEEISAMPNGYCFMIFQSAKRYQLDMGVAHVAKGGGFVSGDSYSVMELPQGKHALAISDGMGNGKRAQKESMQTLTLLQQILQSGIDEQVAIKSINSILSLRMTDEMFSTLDLVMIDLQTAEGQFLKIGSTPSFIKRRNEVLCVESSNLPIGIIKEFDVDVVDEQLESGDLLIMMSDGMFEARREIENQDIWLKRMIREIETDEPQEVADLLLERVVRETIDTPQDDMTVLVAKVEAFHSKWATVPYYTYPNQIS